MIERSRLGLGLAPVLWKCLWEILSGECWRSSDGKFRRKDNMTPGCSLSRRTDENFDIGSIDRTSSSEEFSTPSRSCKDSAIKSNHAPIDAPSGRISVTHSAHTADDQTRQVGKTWPHWGRRGDFQSENRAGCGTPENR